MDRGNRWVKWTGVKLDGEQVGQVKRWTGAGG